MATVRTNPSYQSDHVRVDYDLDRDRLLVLFPATVDENNEAIAATSIELTPAEAVELSAGMMTVAISATSSLLTKYSGRPAAVTIAPSGQLLPPARTADPDLAPDCGCGHGASCRHTRGGGS